MTQTESSGLDTLFRFLVSYRLLIYFGGLFLIAVPLVAKPFGITVPGTARTVVVVVVLAVMVLTYLGERRVGVPESGTEPTRETYPRKMRLMLVLAFVGIAVGVYVALEVNMLTGLLFIAGAYLFGYMGYRSGLEDD